MCYSRQNEDKYERLDQDFYAVLYIQVLGKHIGAIDLSSVDSFLTQYDFARVDVKSKASRQRLHPRTSIHSVELQYNGKIVINRGRGKVKLLPFIIGLPLKSKGDWLNESMSLVYGLVDQLDKGDDWTRILCWKDYPKRFKIPHL